MSDYLKAARQDRSPGAGSIRTPTINFIRGKEKQHCQDAKDQEAKGTRLSRDHCLQEGKEVT